MIREGEEILFTYGKAYWDRWGGDGDLTPTQVPKRDGTVLVARTASSDGAMESSFHELSSVLNMYPVVWMVHIH